MAFELSDRLESLRDDIESDIRNGMVSADTKLIAKSLLFVGLQLMQLTVDTEEISNDMYKISDKLEDCATQLKEIDGSLNQVH